MQSSARASVAETDLSEPAVTTSTSNIYPMAIWMSISTTTLSTVHTDSTLINNGGFTQTVPAIVKTYVTVITSGYVTTSTSTSWYKYVNTPISASFYQVNASNEQG
jgi:hypothetical protein